MSPVEDHHFLTDLAVSDLLSNHPNSCNVESIPDINWRFLVQRYISGDSEGELPESIIQLVDRIRQLQFCRDPNYIPKRGFLKLPTEVGMSPKKAHEVTRMVTYIVHLVRLNGLPESQLRIVDVGAGQGYLTRALKFHLPNAHILALDVDEAQTGGARRWEDRLLPDANPPIFHRTILITPETLVSVVDDWIADGTAGKADSIPVIFVALHACGSLTPDVFRAYMHSRSRRNTDRIGWHTAAVVAVGCCYNLMYPEDFPLSTTLRRLQPIVNLPTAAFHLAAQVPSQWLSSVSPPLIQPSVELSTKKVVYRACISSVLGELSPPDHPSKADNASNKSATVPVPWTRRPETWTEEPRSGVLDTKSSGSSGTGHNASLVRLGKINDRSYISWNAFLEAVGRKLSVDSGPWKGSSDDDPYEEEIGRKLAVLHTLRCLLGPVIESAILRDRVHWVEEFLAGTNDSDASHQIQLVNLFNQSSGSGRNVALVLAEKLPLSC